MKKTDKVFKKNEIIKCFNSVASSDKFNGNPVAAAEETLKVLNIVEGVFILDLEINDFKKTKLKKERIKQIVARSSENKKIFPKMIVELLAGSFVGNVNYCYERKTNGEHTSEPVDFSTKISEECFKTIKTESEKLNLSTSIFVEKAILAMLG